MLIIRIIMADGGYDSCVCWALCDILGNVSRDIVRTCRNVYTLYRTGVTFRDSQASVDTTVT
jgi:uncharacterized protein YifN (PemK superfamily)